MLLLVTHRHDGSEQAHVPEVADHPLLRGGGLAFFGTTFDVGTLDLRIEGDALFDVHLEARLPLMGERDGVADLALQSDVGDETLAGDGVGPGHAASVRVAVGVAVLDIDEEDVVVLTGGVQVRVGHSRARCPFRAVLSW